MTGSGVEEEAQAKNVVPPTASKLSDIAKLVDGRAVVDGVAIPKKYTDLLAMLGVEMENVKRLQKEVDLQKSRREESQNQVKVKEVELEKRATKIRDLEQELAHQRTVVAAMGERAKEAKQKHTNNTGALQNNITALNKKIKRFDNEMDQLRIQLACSVESCASRDSEVEQLKLQLEKQLKLSSEEQLKLPLEGSLANPSPSQAMTLEKKPPARRADKLNELQSQAEQILYLEARLADSRQSNRDKARKISDLEEALAMSDKQQKREAQLKTDHQRMGTHLKRKVFSLEAQLATASPDHDSDAFTSRLLLQEAGPCARTLVRGLNERAHQPDLLRCVRKVKDGSWSLHAPPDLTSTVHAEVTAAVKRALEIWFGIPSADLMAMEGRIAGTLLCPRESANC